MELDDTDVNATITSEAQTGTYLAIGKSSSHHLPTPSTDLSVVKLKTTSPKLKETCYLEDHEFLLFNEVIGSRFKLRMWEV